MPATRVADIIVPEVFNPYVIKRTKELSALFRSGIVLANNRLDVLARSGGKTVQMPFFNDLSGEEEILSDESPLTVGKIDTDQDDARLHMRGKAWGVNDLAEALSGADPMAAIGDLVADYWARRKQAHVIATLNGIFADNLANDGGDMIVDVASEDGNNAGATNVICGEAILDAAQTMGDAKDNLVAIAMHSMMENRLSKNDLIEVIRDSEGKIIQRVFMGLEVFVDDGCPVVDGETSGKKYTTYLFGKGALGAGDGAAPVPTETDRDSLQGDDILINRNHYLLHPRGIKWTENTVAAKSPTNAECALAANWDRVYERKHIRLVKLVTN